MKSEAMKFFPTPWLIAIALLLFVVAFSVIVYRTYKRARKPMFDEISRLPLKEDTHGQ